jgi:hypothetical protein
MRKPLPVTFPHRGFGNRLHLTDAGATHAAIESALKRRVATEPGESAIFCFADHGDAEVVKGATAIDVRSIDRR